MSQNIPPVQRPPMAARLSSDCVLRRSLSQLPNEIILSIAEFLAVPDLNSLLQSDHRFNSLLTSRLYRFAATYTITQKSRQKSPLTWAAEYERVATVRKLLDAGADVNAVIDGFSALHHAVQKGHADITRRLLDAGADPSQFARDGNTPLTTAARLGHENIVHQLLKVTSANTTSERGEYKRALCRAVYFGHTGIVRAMLENVGVPNRSTSDNAGGHIGWFDMSRDEDLILEAARSGNCDMIRLLFDFGAKVPPIHRRSNHPLIVAAQKGHKEAVQLFIAAGEDSRYEDKRDEVSL
ncbi:ankyrin repeat-containing domain protein [Aspergillus crustosus]